MFKNIRGISAAFLFLFAALSSSPVFASGFLDNDDQFDFFANDIVNNNSVTSNTAQTASVVGSWVNGTTARNIALNNLHWNGVPAGKGVKVAIIDGGIDLDHKEFTGRVLKGTCLLGATRCAVGDLAIGGDASKNTTAAAHGSHVAGIIAGSTVGLAPQALLLPIKVCDSTGNCLGSIPGAMQFAAQQGASVVNISLGGGSYNGVYTTYTARAIAQGSLIVVAAGNSSAVIKNTDLMGGLALQDGIRGGLIVVGALDTNGNLAYYSNRPGTTSFVSKGVTYYMKDYFVVAPGTGIKSAVAGGGYGGMSGTSMAAPFVSGVAALIKGQWSYLTPNQISSIIFKTAIDLGAPGVDAVYGNGEVNPARALSPVGLTVIPKVATTSTTTKTTSSTSTTTGTVKTASIDDEVDTVVTPGANAYTSRIVLSSAFGRGFGANVGPVLAVDEYNRGYQMDGSSLIQVVPAGIDTLNLLSHFGKEDLEEVAPGIKAAFDGTHVGTTSLPRSRMQFTNGDGSVLETGFGINPALGFGALGSNTVSANALIVEDGIGSPYLGLATQATSVRVALPLGYYNTTLNVGAFKGSSTGVSLDHHIDDPSYVAPTVYGGIVEATRPLSFINGRIGFNTGVVFEKGAMLGSVASGAFGGTLNTTTNFVGVSGESELTDGFGLFASYSYGMSQADVSGDSLVNSYGTIKTDSFAVGLVKNGVLQKEDRLGFAVSQPLRVSGGAANLTVPYAQDENGSILSHNVNADLAPDGRELDLQGFYTGYVNDYAKVDAGVITRMSPNNQSGAPMEAVGLVKLKMNF